MTKAINLSIEIASDMFLAGGEWYTVRVISEMNGEAIAVERRRYVAMTSEGNPKVGR